MKIDKLILMLFLTIIFNSNLFSQETPLHKFLGVEGKANLSMAYKWLDIAEEATARNVDKFGARPTILSRTLAIWATAMYDAWSAYDKKAIATQLEVKLRRPEKEHTISNKNKAISYASYEALVFCYPESKEWLDEKMRAFGYDPKIVSSDPKKPEGIGHLSATALIEYRKNDGANQLGNEAGGTTDAYSDYTFYQPTNPPDKIIDPDRWQPITFTLSDGKKITPSFLTPHWYRVKPFLMTTSAQFRPGPPPRFNVNPEEIKAQADIVLKYNKELTNEQKAVVEFMRDGPRSTGQSGHWLRFAQDLSRRDHYDLDKDVKLFFAVANVAMDAFISCWETKRFYDSSRPWTLIHFFYKDKNIIGWAGPDGGIKEMLGQDWHPYSPESFITPPFPGYTSGHATVSGAAAKIIALYSGTDIYGFAEKRNHCELTEKYAGKITMIDLPTWSKTAEMAAQSRALGGYHIPYDNDIGLKVGREIAVWSWPKYKAYFDGTFKK